MQSAPPLKQDCAKSKANAVPVGAALCRERAAKRPQYPAASIPRNTLLLHRLQLAKLLTGQPADDPDRLVNPRRVAEAQLRVVLALQHLVMLDQRLAEQFEGPDVALEGRQAFMVRHGAPPGWRGWRGTGCRLGRRLGMGWPRGFGGGERMRGSCTDLRNACMRSFSVEAPHHRRQTNRVAAVRRLANRGKGTRQTRRSPTHSRHCTDSGHKKSACNRDRGAVAPFSVGSPNPVAEMAATGEI